MSTELNLTAEYRELITELKKRVRRAQIKAAVAANNQLIELYWDIGKLITERQKKAGWGDNVVDQISHDLSQEFGVKKGYSRRNLFRMKRFYSFYFAQSEFVPQAVAQIPWGHNDLIIQKIKDEDKARWYVQQTLENGWSRDILGFQIENQLYERQVTAKKIDNFSERLPAPQSELARDTIKDPYIFDFLDVDGDAHERRIENALVDRVTHFLLEMGKGFAFIGKQYHLEVGGDDFYIDLLCYNVRLHAYVILEIKNRAFKPADSGQLNFYLSVVDDQLRTEGDHPSIGLILCKDKNNIVAEYALRGMSQPIGVSQFELSPTLPDELRDSLPTLEEVQEEFGKDDDDEV